MTCRPRGDQGARGHLWPGQAIQVCGGSRILVPSWQHLLPMPTAPGDVPRPVSPPSSTPRQGERGTGGSLPGTGQSPRIDSDTREATVVLAVPANQVPVL